MFTFVLFTRDVGRLIDLLVRSTTTPGMVLWLFVLLLPPILTVTIPMGVLVGTLIGLSRMASDSEVTAVRASGMNITTFVKPVAVLAVIGSGLGLWCATSLGPRSVRELLRIENAMRAMQVSAEIQPRIFEERFPNMVLYVNDTSSTDAEQWRGLFLADLQPSAEGGPAPSKNSAATDPNGPSSAPPAKGPKITVATRAVTLADPGKDHIQLHMIDGATHELTLPTPGNAPSAAGAAVNQAQKLGSTGSGLPGSGLPGSGKDDYVIYGFSESDITVDLPAPEVSKARPFTEQSMHELLRVPLGGDEGRAARIEFHRRLAWPIAALVLATVAIPLGVSSRKGGKSAGVVLALVLVLSYYVLWMMGLSLARDGRVPAGLGAWLPNIIFMIAGLTAVARAERMRRGAGIASTMGAWIKELEGHFTKVDLSGRPSGFRRIGSGFPQILDGYVLRSFLFYFTVFLSSFVLLAEIITLFDLLTDIFHYRSPWSTVASYFFFLAPDLIYRSAPLAVLVAALVSFALLTKDNEITAMKACGVSLYRVSVPVFLAAVMISSGLFTFDHFYLPQANRKQDALRDQIKHRAPQTYLRPDRQWILGQHSRIYYYNYFDYANNLMAGLTVFELDPKTFQVRRRIAADRAHWDVKLNAWVLEQGWVRDFKGPDLAGFTPFTVKDFPELEEKPSYFKQEKQQSQQMNYIELRHYIADLEQRGFDVVPLLVQLHKKFAFPLYAPIMALIAVPFAFSVGRRGALAGIGASMAIAMVYWTVTVLFEKMGNINELPAVLATWIPAAMFGMTGLYLLLKVRT
jgi:LPS export ABC transporter permease LptG